MPNVDIVDMRAGQGPAALISDRLAVELESCVRAGGQAIVFLNKRGHARYVQCSACGWVAQCGECDISLTYHRIDSRIKCHLCGYHVRAPERCPECGAPRLRYAGVGTQRVELDLAALLPGVGVLRMDADSTGGKQGHRRVLEAFGSGRYSILLGTQMVTKGHHFPRVQLVGVLSAEDSLNFPDFRSVERTFQTLTQVAGRAGRSNAPGRVVVQTYAPDHYIFDYLVRHDYEGFMDEELRLRRQLLYPPFTRLVLAAGTCRDPDLLHRAMSGLAEAIRSRYADVKVLGPAPPPVARVKGRFREQILLKGTLRNDAKREILGAFKDQAARLGAARALDFRWDVDPESFL